MRIYGWNGSQWVPVRVSATGAIAQGGPSVTEMISVSAGADWVAFPVSPCEDLVLANLTGVTVSFRWNGGVAAPLPDRSSFTVQGISNASQVEVRREDGNTTPVTVYGTARRFS